MSPMRLIILLVAAGAAIAAVFLVRTVQAPQPATAAETVVAQPSVALTEVLTARNNIEPGKFITVDDLKWEEWPEDAASKTFIAKKDQPEALEKFVGAVARVGMVEGEPIVADRLVHPGTAGFMSAMLSPGMRAVSIEISPESGAGGFIQPNDRVDVIVTREIEVQDGAPSGGMQNIRSDLILSNIRVLAIDAVYNPPAAEGEEKAKEERGVAIEGSRATLELTEQDATLVASAQKAGTLSLSLRSITGLQEKSGATPVGRVYRDGLPTEAQGIRVYRYGTEGRARAS